MARANFVSKRAEPFAASTPSSAELQFSMIMSLSPLLEPRMGRLTRIEFYVRAAFLPFIVPAAGLCLLLLGRLLPRSIASTAIAGVGGILSLVGAFSVIPYCIFLFFFLHFRTKLSESAMNRVSWLLPLIFAVAVAVFLGISGAIREEPSLYRPGFLLVWSGLVLAVGYAYVFLIRLILVVALKTGLVEQKPSRL